MAKISFFLTRLYNTARGKRFSLLFPPFSRLLFSIFSSATNSLVHQPHIPFLFLYRLPLFIAPISYFFLNSCLYRLVQRDVGRRRRIEKKKSIQTLAVSLKKRWNNSRIARGIFDRCAALLFEREMKNNGGGKKERNSYRANHCSKSSSWQRFYTDLLKKKKKKTSISNQWRIISFLIITIHFTWI